MHGSFMVSPSSFMDDGVISILDGAETQRTVANGVSDTVDYVGICSMKALLKVSPVVGMVVAAGAIAGVTAVIIALKLPAEVLIEQDGTGGSVVDVADETTSMEEVVHVCREHISVGTASSRNNITAIGHGTTTVLFLSTPHIWCTVTGCLDLVGVAQGTDAGWPSDRRLGLNSRTLDVTAKMGYVFTAKSTVSLVSQAIYLEDTPCVGHGYLKLKTRAFGIFVCPIDYAIYVCRGVT